MKLSREELLNIYRKFDNPKKDRDSVIAAMEAAVDATMDKLVEPDQALLISMACCLNHGFGLLDKEAQDSMLYEMRKLYNEVVGKGYYSPEVRERYLNILSSVEDNHT